MNNINTNLIKAIVKTQMEKYGDLLVNLYQKVKNGGALTTTDNEKKALYNLAENYSNLRGGNTPVNEIDFTNLVRNIKQNKPLQQMIQWGGTYQTLAKTALTNKHLSFYLSQTRILLCSIF